MPSAMAFPAAAAFEARGARVAGLPDGRPEAAAARLTDRCASPDRVMLYLRHLVFQVRSCASNRAARGRGAGVSRRARGVARRTVGARQPHVLGLGGLGHRIRGARAGQRVQTEPVGTVDPWWLYWQGRSTRGRMLFAS